MIALWFAPSFPFSSSTYNECGKCVKRLKNVAHDLETKRKQTEFDSHERSGWRSSPVTDEDGKIRCGN